MQVLHVLNFKVHKNFFCIEYIYKLAANESSNIRLQVWSKDQTHYVTITQW